MLYLLELNLASIVRRNCIAQCSFQMSFDDQLERPLNCSEQILSYTCIARITILYNTRTIFVYFRTTGFEHNENELSLYTIQQVSHIFQRNHSSYVIIFACIFADNCDWIYTRDIINRFTRVNYTLMFMELILDVTEDFPHYLMMIKIIIYIYAIEIFAIIQPLNIQFNP
jgi:hypothetical protein